MNGIHEVRGSIPLISTKTKTCPRQVFLIGGYDHIWVFMN